MSRIAIELPKPWNTPEAIDLWKTDPLACLLKAAEDDANLQSYFRKEYADKDPHVIQGAWGCWFCQKTVEKTAEALLALAITAAVGSLLATDGADAEALPEGVELAVQGSADVLAAESGAEAADVPLLAEGVIKKGFSWMLNNKVKAIAMYYSGELLGDLFFTPLSEALCNAGGRCPT